MACGDDPRLPRWAQCNLKGGSRVEVGEEIRQQKLRLEQWKKGTLNQEFRKPLETRKGKGTHSSQSLQKEDSPADPF